MKTNAKNPRQPQQGNLVHNGSCVMAVAENNRFASLKENLMAALAILIFVIVTVQNGLFF